MAKTKSFICYHITTLLVFQEVFEYVRPLFHFFYKKTFVVAGNRTHGSYNDKCLWSGCLDSSVKQLHIFLPCRRFKKGQPTASYIVYFRSFRTNTMTIFTINLFKNVYPVYSTMIRTHNLKNMSLLS